ncbi:MAG: protein-glutamate O-methyltransferase CheR [Acidobacteriaceae bacterium]|jgi:chemotaxis protein methyltransferase CheR
MGCSDSDYAYLRQLVLAESANLIDPSRNALFETRLTPIARLAGASTLEDFVSLLRVDRTPQLHRAVAEAMTINETSFFRDGKPFEVLRETILPRLIEKNAAQRRLRIWSAASSTGQEAYSLAMLICENFAELTSWDVKIVGTDISRQVIEYAQRGRYRRMEVNRGLPARMLVKYLVRDGDEWEVTPNLRAMCSFQYANLCAPLPKLPAFDLVMLRNVLLYFPQQDRSCVFSDVYRQMTPGGYLMLGAAEQAEDSTNLFHAEFARDCYFYRPIPSS